MMTKVRIITLFSYVITMASALFSCSIEDSGVTPRSGFKFETDTRNALTVKFTNTSSNAVSYKWDFADGSEVSTEVSPSHRFEGDGEFEVTLTAINGRHKIVS